MQYIIWRYYHSSVVRACEG